MKYKFTKSRHGGALIVSPYLDHLGGGERYMLSAASMLSALGYQLHFAWDNEESIRNLAALLGIELPQFELVPSIKNLYLSSSPMAMFRATRPYDVVIYLSDGSLPLLGGKKNILHMQVPFHDVNGRSVKNIIKKQFISSVIVNSQFTKKIVDREYGIESVVLYPPVPMIGGSGVKDKIILSVGRFEPSLNAKKQDILIQAFRLLTSKLPGWKLILAGASNSQDWVTQLQKQASGLNIDFQINADYSTLQNLYRSATIYWHAAGYGIDESKNPELTEHFGISTVEAISAGCIPLVVGKGGQPEIVHYPELLWQSPEELVAKTLSVINNQPQFQFDIEVYDLAHFNHGLKNLL